MIDKELITNLKNEIYELKEENKELKERIDKAIEYIKEHTYINDDCDYGFEKSFTAQDEELDKLFSILEGDKQYMNIDIEQYIINDIGNTSWYGETNHDNESMKNLEVLDSYLTKIEDLREMLLLKLEEHINYNKGNYSAEILHNKAKKIMSKHILKEFTHTDFNDYWGDK